MLENDPFEEFISSINREAPTPQQKNTLDTSVVSEYLSPTDSLVVNQPPKGLEKFQSKNLQDRSPAFQVFKGSYTLDDLENNPEFVTRASRFMESIEDDEDIFEYLRDSDFSLSSAIVRSAQVKGWSDEAQEDYTYLRQMFDQADIGSTKQYLQLGKDLAVDIVADPLNWLAAVFFVPSGGFTGAAGLAAKELGKQGLKQLSKKQIGKAALKGAKQPAIYGASEGAAWGGAHDYFIQNAEVELGMRDEINWGQTAITTGLGAGLGGIFGGAIGAVSVGGSLLRKKYSNYSDEGTIIQRSKDVDRKELEAEYEDEQFIKTVNEEADQKPKRKKKKKKKTKETVKKISTARTYLANTFGKPVSELAEIAQNSTKVQYVLSQFRHDWAKSLTQGATKVLGSSYGEELNVRMSGYLTEMREAVGELNRTKVDFFKFSTYKNTLDDRQNTDLVWLLRLNKKSFNEIVNLRKVHKNTDIPASELSKRSLIDKDIDVQINILEKNIKNDAGNIIDEDVIRSAAKIRDILNRIFDEASGGTKVFDGSTGININLMTRGQQVTNFFPRHFAHSKIIENKEPFTEIIARSEHSNPSLDPKEAAKIEYLDVITGEVVKDEAGKAIKVFPATIKSVDEEVFGWENYQAIKKLVDKGKLTEAKQLKAELIVQNMIDKRYSPFSFGTENNAGGGSSFLQHRVFNSLDDNELAPFLENSVEDVLEKYIMNSSRAITRTAYFGRTEDDFINRFIDGKGNTIEQLREAGVSEDQIAEVTRKLKNMYNRVTGLDATELQWQGKAGTFLDVAKLTQQTAHLPLATLSSVTEPMILLSRIDTTGGKISAGGQVGKAIVKGVKKDLQKFKYFVQRASGKEVKGYADMQDEYWHEAYKVGLALEQGVMSHLEGLYGEAAKNSVARGLQNAFFKANLLTSWTGAVQIASFTTGKRLIRENSEQLYLHSRKNNPTKLSVEKRELLTEQLWDLGINNKEAINWYRNSLTKGVFDEGKSRGANLNIKENVRKQQYKFYENQYTKGANRFTREIILNPSTSEANRPLWFSHPAGQLLAQFAGYPTVFNNTILKRWSYEVAEDARRLGKGQIPQSTGKILGTAVAMSTVATYMNALRSGGKSLEQEDSQIILEGIQRWGGLGPADIFYRMQQNTLYGSGPAGTALKALPGPIVSDIVDSIAYRKGIPEILITNAPFYSALPKETRDAMKKGARDLNNQLWKSAPKEKKRSSPINRYGRSSSSRYAKGGIVTDVPNASIEPDEKKVRGLPVTYAELGGVLAQDVEDRKGFVLGGIVDRIAKVSSPSTKKHLTALTDQANEDEVIKHLTKETRKAVPIFEDNSTSYLSTKEEATKFAKNVEKEAIRYIDSDKLNVIEEELMYSTELGAKATTKPKASGGKKIKHKGRLRLVRPLELGTVSPEQLTGSRFVESLQTNQALRTNIIKNSPLPDEDAKRLLKELENSYKDTQKFIAEVSTYPTEVTQPLLDIKQSIKVRETLTDLGYDSIRYNDSEYILFDNNQFSVTKKLRLNKMAGGLVRPWQLAMKQTFKKIENVGNKFNNKFEETTKKKDFNLNKEKELNEWMQSLSEEETFYLEHYMLNDDPLKYLPENDPFYEALLISMTPDEWKKGFAEGGRVGYANGEEVEEDLTEQLAMLKKIQEAETQYGTKEKDREPVVVREDREPAVVREDREPVVVQEDKEPVVVQEDKKQVISDKELADHTELLFNHSAFNITNPNRMRNQRLLIDTIWQMESRQGKNKNTQLGGPYQMFASTQSDAINLAGGLRAKHSDGKGSNFNKKQLDYLENTLPNEMQDNATRLLMTQIFFSRAVKADDYTDDNRVFNIGKGTELLQEYHENPTWEKSKEIYLKLWVYEKEENYAKKTATLENPEGDDIGPNLLKGEEYWNKHSGKSLQELQEIAPTPTYNEVDSETKSGFFGQKIKDIIPAHAEVYLKKVLFGDREPITEKVFDDNEYKEIAKSFKYDIIESLNTEPTEDNVQKRFFDEQGRLRSGKQLGVYVGPEKWGKIHGSYQPFVDYDSILPKELYYTIGAANFNLKKGDYNKEKLTITSDKYDFGPDYSGMQTKPGFNLDNIREYYDLLQSGDWETAAERFAMERIPDDDTVKMWEKEYGVKQDADFAPVNISIPVSDMFTEKEWERVQSNDPMKWKEMLTEKNRMI